MVLDLANNYNPAAVLNNKMTLNNNNSTKCMFNYAVRLITGCI